MLTWCRSGWSWSYGPLYNPTPLFLVDAIVYRYQNEKKQMVFPKHEQAPNPAALSVCSESREIALTKYRLCFGTPDVYADLEIDILYFGPGHALNLEYVWECTQRAGVSHPFIDYALNPAAKEDLEKVQRIDIKYLEGWEEYDDSLGPSHKGDGSNQATTRRIQELKELARSSISAPSLPRYYPHSPSTVSKKEHDLDDWVPERWFSSLKQERGGEPEITSIPNAPKRLFVPAKGSYIPFSERARSCPGKRFAQIEIIAVLSVIFKTHSVELDVSAWASDEDIETMGKDERRVVYEKAIKRARRMMFESETIVVLQMQEKCPLRFVKRGGERFRDCYV
ncbi:hypothetical protein LHYA1_G006628 [Lachnellula hyalina]|uniref:2EXR domain-containing protein n=1 Tax=Lachnellula hyalina TaxID=1316788 RepID=A0A8H8R030_9HELO|nr:uncharacterized protein LHYA1_G006628 [Lachnellula hyalina]TVY24439.1 hypothetical protein LHYA1_G006628 [Lachnellula hyalina]